MSRGASGTGDGKRGGTRGRTQRTRRGTKAGGFSGRSLKEKVRTAKGRSTSSTRWLKRQLSDPYVEEAQRRGYRARSAFKLAQMDDKLRLIRRGARVLDLGAAPGSWSQVALERAGAGTQVAGQVVGIDLEEVEPLAGATFLVGDVREPETAERLRAALSGPADLVMSDMAAAATGHGPTDHLRTMALVEAALDIAEALLAPGGAFVAKVLQGGTEAGLLARLKRGFRKVQHIKPPASRKDSAELYVAATGFRGVPEEPDSRPEEPPEGAPQDTT